MWQDSQKNSGTGYWNGIIFCVVSVIGVVAIVITYWKSITSSGDDMVDRTNLLI